MSTETDQSAAKLPPYNAAFVVAGTTSVQATMSLAVTMLASIAPALATALDIPAAWIGFQVSIVFGCASLFSIFAGVLVRRWGACRASQTALVLGMGGCVLAIIPHVGAIAAASVLIGLGYALTNPSASHLLSRFAGTTRRNLVFSIKQTGVPVGYAIGGLIGPTLTVHLGWQSVPVAVGATLLTLLLLLQIRRSLWDDDRDPGWKIAANLHEGLQVIWRRKPIRWLVTASFFYTVTQLSLVAFLVNLLVIDAKMTLVQAGLVMFAVQIASAFGRLMWGWIADKVGNGAAVLAAIGAIAGAAAALSTLVGPTWPYPGIVALFMVFGVAAIGWNGVFMAEVARLSPIGRVGPVTGASLAITFAGVAFGPSGLSALHDVLGSYVATFGVLAVTSIVGAAFVVTSGRALRAEAVTPPQDRS